jgi:hypothetical protein
VEEDLSIGMLAYLFHWLYDAYLIIHRHYADKTGVRPDCGFEILHVDKTTVLHWQVRDLEPSSCRCRQLSSTHLCSVWLVMMCFFFPERPKNLATPLMLMLLLSVARS